MQLLVIRHAIAEDRDAFAGSGRDDSERPLTGEGREKMGRAVSGLRRLVPAIDILASSPYARAMETAQIVAAGYGLVDKDIVAVDALTPDAPLQRFVSWIQRRSKTRVATIVGHEPHLGVLVTWLMTGLPESRVELKKGGACLLEFNGQPGPGIGVMRWLMTSGQLRER
ncbi:MAG TPA: histidine phosphatase family protein [Vicinamibacterales bacterium]|nr:histidine phosphatase family protein [Vicinamibacterales bacterium]